MKDHNLYHLLVGGDRFDKFRYKDSSRKVYGYGAKAEESQGKAICQTSAYKIVL